MVKIWTDRVSYRGEDAIDTTVKSAKTLEGCLLMPKWEIVMEHKKGKISDEQYTKEYLNILRYRYKMNKTAFLDLLKRYEITLLCYCAKGKFCHRHIAAEILKKIADAHGIECELCGER
jgi:uncharacterized protein YeaO (DUF488 family)